MFDIIEKEYLDMIDEIDSNCGELDQLKITMSILDNLISWVDLNIDNDKELEQCNKLKQAKDLLYNVYKDYKN